MKKILFIIFMVCSLPMHANTAKDDLAAIQALAKRIIPEQAGHFIFKVTKSQKDQFRLESKGQKIQISGNNANSMAVGLNHYLKYYCKVEVGWFSHDTFTMPAKLPKVTRPVTVDARVKDRFFLNYCTFGYTMPWWQWEEWEHFIDWMALNGVNLPLAITGQESIWYQVWTELGLSDEEVRNYFTGPSHLPWHRMLNIDYWQGPLPKSWLDGQLKLQQKITARERELNMKPVLPAFAGHVPYELTRIYPDAKITKLEPWSGYSADYACSFLDPMDPLFAQVQQKFLETERKLYGTDHIYGIDLFNELMPPSWEPEYLSRVSRQVYETLEAVDPQAIWLQMTWLFYNERQYWTNDKVKPYITSYPAEHSLLLDYYCERMEVWQRTEKYYGVPYIWCYLGNFGGNTMLMGNISEINTRIENTFENGGKNFQGIGSTLEGFDCNPFMYEYVFEKAWNFDLHKDVTEWMNSLADQRLGRRDAKERAAWQLMKDSVYTEVARPGHSSLISIRPTFGKYKTYYANPRVPYQNKTLLTILDNMLQADGNTHSYSFDITNVTRQLLSNYFLDVFKKYEKAYTERDRETMGSLEKEMLEIIDDVDRMISTQSYFLVGKWIKDSRSWGVNQEESDYFESNARNLITTWSDKDMLLNDYASRTWAGLTKTFYGVRWKMFFDAVNAALDNGSEFGEKEFEAYKNVITTYEKAWWEQRLGNFTDVPVGDSKAIANELFRKYKDKI